jgi:hypothetical protein
MGHREPAGLARGRVTDRTAEGRLARWCRRRPVIGKTMEPLQIAERSGKRCAHCTTNRRWLRCCTYCTYCTLGRYCKIIALLQIAGRSSDPQSDRRCLLYAHCSLLMALWVHSSNPPLASHPSHHQALALSRPPRA